MRDNSLSFSSHFYLSINQIVDLSVEEVLIAAVRYMRPPVLKVRKKREEKAVWFRK